MIGLANYAPNVAMNGFGFDDSANVAELEKALQAGYQFPPSSGGSALRVESLEGSLKVVTYTAHHIKFWKKIPKSPAYSTVEEYNQLVNYGGNANAFVQEGELPPTQDSTYARRTALIKYIGTTREVTHPMTVVHPAHGDVIALENQNGILWLLQRIEQSLFTGNSTLAFSGQAEQWDGLDNLIDSTSFYDLAGNPMQEADIEETANTLVEQFAYPTDLWMSTRTASDLVKTMYPRERINLPAPQNGQIGMSVTSVMTQAGVMELNPDVFITKLPTPPSAATSPNAPATPTSIVSTANTGVTNGNFSKGNPSGTIQFAYVVTAANRFGESAPTAVQGSTTSLTGAQALAGARIDQTITNAGTIGSFPPEYFRIYRTQAVTAVPAGLSSYSLIMQVAAASQTASATTTASDLNFILPFTSQAYLGEMTPSVLTFRQLLPMMRLDLAVLAPSYRWMILLYGTPVLFATKKFLRLINIGTLTAS